MKSTCCLCPKCSHICRTNKQMKLRVTSAVLQEYNHQITDDDFVSSVNYVTEQLV